MGDVSVNNTELEYLKLQRIRHALQDYRYYNLKREWLEEKIAEVDAKLDGNIPALKTGEASGSVVQGNWIVAAIVEQDELISLKVETERNLSFVEDWLTIVENELGQMHRRVLEVYAIAEGYENADKCVDLLGLKNRSSFYRILKKAESCILEKVKNFKNC